MNLFIQPMVRFEKTAGEATLPEDPNTWPNEVLQELFKQVPYIADFEPHVVMDKVDAERGYGFGHVEIMNKTEVQHGASAEGLQAAGVKHVRIPVVVKNRRLQPFDIMVTEDSKLVPLTEQRIRTAIFRPSAFDVTGRTPGDQSMIGQLYPPYRQNFGFGGGGAALGMGSTGKYAAANDSILASILPTIEPEDYDRFFSHFQDAGVKAAFVANHKATEPVLQKLSSWKPQPVAEPNVVPSVVQILKEADGYTIKSASHRFWSPKQETWDRGQLVKTFGAKIAMDVDMQGSVTMAAGEGMKEAPDVEGDKFELVKDFGLYKVRTEEGKDLIGYVFPNLMDVDGTPLPLALFTNGSEKALQGEIVGVPVASGAAMLEGHPRGTGLFYETTSNGKANATVPMTIVASLAGPGDAGGGVTLHGRTFDGQQVELEVQPNIAKIMGTPEGKMLVPDTMKWLPLDSAKDVVLVGDADMADAGAKMAAANPTLTVQIRCGGEDSFSLAGFPVEKIASEKKTFLSYDDALFLLGGCGVDLEHASMKLAQALMRESAVEVQAGRPLITAEQMMLGAVKTAEKHLSKLPDFRKDLVKEAAVIPDPTAVDTVLSLGFVNPENMLMFVGYLPKIDEAQKRLCELLLASRLGLKDIPTPALEKAIRAVEEVIQGLRVMAFQQQQA